MKIIIKFLLNNIKEKKFRTFLIVFSITMSAALYFASNAMSTTIVDMYSGIIKSYFGSSEIMVTADENSPSGFFYENKADAIKSEVDYAIGSIQLSGVYTPEKGKNLNVNISLSGYDLKDLQLMNPLTLENEVSSENFSGKKIIISKNTAEKYKFALGDYIKLDIKDTNYKFQIVGISKNLGVFLSEKQNTMAIVPKQELYALGSGRGMVSTLYVKTKNPLDKQKIIDRLKIIYKNYSVRETISDKELKEASDSIVVPLNMMGIIVMAISMFIIYSAFKVITTERLPIVGTFRSIGATKKMMNIVLLGESIMYGIIGGVVGVLVGFGVLYLMATIVAQMFGGVKTTINFTTGQMIAAFILAVVLSLISSMLPIISVSKISVKDIVLNNVIKSEKNSKWKLVLAIIFILFATISPRYTPKNLALLIDGIAMILVLIATVYLVPFITIFFVKILEKVYIYVFGNEGVLAVKNLRGNKSVLNNISLLAIGMSALLMISTISTSLALEIPRIYKQWNFEIMLAGNNLNYEFLNLITNTKGVTDVYGVYGASQVKISNSKETIGKIEGVNKNNFLDFYDVTFLGDGKAMLDKLPLGRNMIIGKALRDRLNLAVGSNISLEINKTKREYTVIGIIDYQFDNGNIGFISDKYFKQDMKVQTYSQFNIKTDIDASVVKKAIDNKYSKRGIYIETLAAMTEMNVQGNAQFMVLLNGFAIMAMVIGSFGIINNFMISFMDRKRSMAMFRSLGMSKKQNIKVLFIESLTGGAIGGVTGIISGIIIISIAPYLVDATSNFFLIMHYSVQTFSTGFILGIVITIMASIGPASKSSKLNIIDAIKYE